MAKGRQFVIFMGPPGAGKGTQAQSVAQGLGLAHIATGDLFREAMSKGTPLGLEAKKFVEHGEYVPDSITLGLVRERLGAEDAQNGAILDGFPRTVQQADSLDEFLKSAGAAVNRVVYLDVPQEVLMERLTGRWTCRNCAAVYHQKYNPPKKVGVCDQCGGELYQRTDDTPEVVGRRLEVYLKQTAPLAERYDKVGLLTKVPGNNSPTEVTESVLSVLRQG